MTSADLDEMPEQWDSLFTNAGEIDVALTLDDLGYNPEDYDELGEDTKKEVVELARQYNELQHEFRKRDDLDRTMANQLNQQQSQIKNRIRDKLSSDENKLYRRGLMVAAGAALFGAGTTAGVLYSGGEGDDETASLQENITEASIDDASEVGDYMEERVEGNQMLSSESNWGDLLHAYESGRGFFPRSDKTLERLEITLNRMPGERSEYAAVVGIDGDQEFTTRSLREDEAAKDALEYFGEL